MGAKIEILPIYFREKYQNIHLTIEQEIAFRYCGIIFLLICTFLNIL